MLLHEVLFVIFRVVSVSRPGCSVVPFWSAFPCDIDRFLCLRDIMFCLEVGVSAGLQPACTHVFACVGCLEFMCNSTAFIHSCGCENVGVWGCYGHGVSKERKGEGHEGEAKRRSRRKRRGKVSSFFASFLACLFPSFLSLPFLPPFPLLPLSYP